jgi:hypothetical protein
MGSVVGEGGTCLLQVVLDVAEADALRRALQQDLAAVLDQGPRRAQDHERDAHADGRVGVESSGGRGEPDDDGGDDDAHVVERIPENVEQRPHHAEVSARSLEGALDVVVIGVAVDGLGRALGAAVWLAVVVGQAQGGLRSGTGFGFGVCLVVIVMVVVVAVVLWTGMSVSASQASELRKD